MISRLLIALLPLLIVFPAGGVAQEANKKREAASRKVIPVYVTPFYNSRGTKVSVGEHSKDLAAADAESVLQLSEKLKEKKDKLRAEVMYVMAIRLYDLGHKDEAVYWFYTAQYRGRVFVSILDKKKVGSLGSEAFELTQAYNSFNRLTGEYINGYAFGDLPKLEKTLLTVVKEGRSLPEFDTLYPKVAFAPQETWAEKNTEVSKGLSGIVDYVKSNADSIKEQRKKNGIEGKY